MKSLSKIREGNNDTNIGITIMIFVYHIFFVKLNPFQKRTITFQRDCDCLRRNLLKNNGVKGTLDGSQFGGFTPVDVISSGIVPNESSITYLL